MKIFISYRREDSAGHTGRLYDSLQAHFGPESLFMDLSAIESGQNFVEAIETAVGSCDALIAVIGKEWLTCTGPHGRRLDDPRDFVRAEIAAALERGTPIIPVLVEGATMPSAEALPDPLKPLADRHAHELSDHRWAYDVRRLIEAAEKLAGKPGRLHRRRWLSLAAAVALVLVLGAVLVLRQVQPRDESIDTANVPVRGAGSEPSGASQPTGNETAPPEAKEPSNPLPTVRLAGEWTAEVTYYRNVTHTERFVFKVDGDEVFGTASYLGTARGILEGTLSDDRILFSTQTHVCYDAACDNPRNVLHRYRGTISGDAIAFYYMQIEEGSADQPREFTATRVSGSATPPTPK
jgi:hypothetical protein